MTPCPEELAHFRWAPGMRVWWRDDDVAYRVTAVHDNGIVAIAPEQDELAITWQTVPGDLALDLDDAGNGGILLGWLGDAVPTTVRRDFDGPWHVTLLGAAHGEGASLARACTAAAAKAGGWPKPEDGDAR